jgi:hypothetical protein
MKATKKPVTIEAVKWNGENSEEIIAFCGDSAFTAVESVMGQTETEELYIKTLEGNLHASVGDYIIRGVNGELYPCKPDIFEKTYDIVDSGNRVREFKETKHDLLTTKYTKVLEESEYTYAPHTFQVIRAQEENSEEHKGENLVLSEIHFQDGPIKECGVNGVCNEDLLVMVIRRLEGFQDSEFKCRENACAITKLEEAMLWLRKRTMGRENRGVEGTHKV